MRGWDRFLTDKDRQIYAKAGFGKAAGFGQRPALLIIDVNYNFCGEQPRPILESVGDLHHTCGEQAWDAIPHIRSLLEVAHDRRIPVIYTTRGPLRPDRWERGRWPDKNSRDGEPTATSHHDGSQIVEEIAPAPCDIVVEKYRPSAFHATMLLSHLVELQADSLIVAGTTTSGCVRASVVDAFSHNYRVSVAEEATFDRGEASHWINLFDMDQKYADVVPVPDALSFLSALPDDLFVRQLPSLEHAPRLAAT